MKTLKTLKEVVDDEKCRIPNPLNSFKNIYSISDLASFLFSREIINSNCDVIHKTLCINNEDKYKQIKKIIYKHNIGIEYTKKQKTRDDIRGNSIKTVIEPKEEALLILVDRYKTQYGKTIREKVAIEKK